MEAIQVLFLIFIMNQMKQLNFQEPECYNHTLLQNKGNYIG